MSRSIFAGPDACTEPCDEDPMRPLTTSGLLPRVAKCMIAVIRLGGVNENVIGAFG